MDQKMKERQELVKMAKGAKKADLVLKNVNIVNVFSGEIEKGDLAIGDGIILGTGDYEGISEVDYSGKYVVPGLIDGHVHIESSMMTPAGFARAVLPRGTTSVIADPHEIANVTGLDGIRYMLNASARSPLDVFVMMPSCVPSTDFENAGAVLMEEDLIKLKGQDNVLGLGEMMNYPGVAFGNESVHEKLLGFEDMPIDGHAPGVTGQELNAYILSGVMTDHECVDFHELKEKVAKGMYIHLREGSATRNVEELCRGITPMNNRWLLFCTDDKHLTDIIEEGHIDYNIKLAIKCGLDPVVAVQMATINIATCYGLKHKGAIAPGYEGDLVVLNDLKTFDIAHVYKSGKLVASDLKPKFEQETYEEDTVLNTIHLKDGKPFDFRMELSSEYVKVICLMDHSINTKKAVRKVDVVNGAFSSNPKVDILKLAVIERHKATGNIGLGLVEGFGLKNGAIGLTIAHDSHNMIVVGDNDDDMRGCVHQLESMTGGICVVSNGKVIESLPLEVGGIMTNAPMEEVVDKLHSFYKTARDMGVPAGIDPVMTLSFLALPVIPELKVTDIGLFDANAFKFVEVEE